MQTLVFDLDGVLVDVSGSFRACIGATMAALGGRPSAGAEIASLKLAGGFNNDWDVTRELLRRQGIAVTRDHVIEAFSRIYRGAPGQGVFGPEGLIHRERWLLPLARLEQLARRFRLAVFTGRPRSDAVYTLKHFEAARFFTAVVALEDAPAKPEPQGLRQLDAHWYIGDTVDDARCALSAGVAFIGICPPASPLEQRCRALGAQFTAASVEAAVTGLLATV